MHADKHRWELERITERVIGCAFIVGNSLGSGFLEKVYENALVHELRKAGLFVQQQYEIEVKYDGVVVGQFFADLLVESSVLVELKAVRTLETNHFAQCHNYLKATNVKYLHFCFPSERSANAVSVGFLSHLPLLC
ncbi:GxxExxY protein [Anabaena azotica]|uniref:GxxExxY protein n=1 Tax=Anabaena azotica FACHB-119 TaxID=947527 RepID=A0ABR8CXM0_9NOST|nr:GxxExxY protein [Anabaena azotica]MBD2499234.1 GxxExxY protein [Anabaena azotica FACHB-119]